MDVRQMIAEINPLLAQLDERFAAAQKAFGVRPDLAVAEERINDAGATLMELHQVLVGLEDVGFSHPPDVVERFRSRYNALHQMAHELSECKMIVNVRSHQERKPETLN